MRRRREARKEERDGSGVGIERGAVFGAEFVLFAAHDKGVDQRKVEQEKNGGDCGMHGDGGTERKKAAAEVKRIAGVGVRAGYGEDFLFVKIAGGERADGQAYKSHESTEENGKWRGSREKKNNGGERVTETDTPASKEVGDGHAGASMRRCTASKT